jgi:putative PEP-CTERM system histidine kinase
MSVISILTLCSAVLCLGLVVLVLWREVKSVAGISFSAALFLLAVESICDALGLSAVDPAVFYNIERVRLLAASLLPGCWLLFTLTFSRGNAQEFLVRNRLLVGFFFALPIVLAAFFFPLVLVQIAIVPAQSWHLRIGWAGVLLHFAFLLGFALALINLERTFRSATGTKRWRIKYLILGCAVLLGARIYTSSQAILLRALESSIIDVEATSRLVGLTLIAFSLLRSGLAEIDLYPSQAFLYRSFTAVLAGAYLLLIGILGRVALIFGGDENVPLKSLIVLIALIGVAILLMSDRVRQAAQQTVARHLRRPIHDYRKVWTLFAERTATLVTGESLCREIARLVSETFSVLSVTIFLVDEQKQQLLFGASTSLPEEKAMEILRGVSNIGSMVEWRGAADPVDMDQSTEPWLVELRKLSPDFFQKGGGRVCVPLVASGQLLGLMTLTDRVSGVPFSPEDFELLKCVAGHVGASLLNIKLSNSLLRSKELEAFQTMSTFFVHDLKNTALMLSLMLKNLPVHFANPEFREDSLRAIAKTTDRINDLISRLTLLRKGLEIHPVETDLNALVNSCLGNIPRSDEIDLQQNLQPLPKIRIDPEQIQKVFTNLVLNARDAVGEAGHIRVATAQTNGWAVVQVSDDGCGISPEFLQRSLFRPFQSTKKKGIGIGMYQSKMIVEAHAGRIEVQSDVGKGTTFRVLLPMNA